MKPEGLFRSERFPGSRAWGDRERQKGPALCPGPSFHVAPGLGGTRAWGAPALPGKLKTLIPVASARIPPRSSEGLLGWGGPGGPVSPGRRALGAQSSSIFPLSRKVQARRMGGRTSFTAGTALEEEGAVNASRPATDLKGLALLALQQALPEGLFLHPAARTCAGHLRQRRAASRREC